MKTKLMILMLLLTSCIKGNFNCPNVVNYTIEEQKEIANILQEQNNKILNRFFIDYYNLREDLKICNQL